MAFITVREMFENGDIDQQAFTDTIEQIDIDIEEKIKNCVILMREHEAKLGVIVNEMERLQRMAEKEEEAADWLRGYISRSMEQTNRDKMDLGLFKLTLKQPTKKTEIFDESAIPDQYFVVIPEMKRVDKASLAAALKLGEVPGASLIDGKRALLIK